MDIHMDIHIWVPRDPWGGSMDTLGGPMGPWDRWDLGTDGTWASRTPDTSSEDTSSELFIDTRPGPAQPGRWVTIKKIVIVGGNFSNRKCTKRGAFFKRF